MRIALVLAFVLAGCARHPAADPAVDAAGPSTGDGGGAADGRSEPAPDADPDEGGLTWRPANLTEFESYPEPGSEECEEFSGCEHAGRFAFVDGQQPEEWVMSQNIAAVHSDVADDYALKTLRLRSGDARIDVIVYDMCSDDDCDGCCTRNSAETGFLIDLESYTYARFGVDAEVVEFACLDCE